MTAPTVETLNIELSTSIEAPVEFLWSMLTNRDDLCDWLCNDAHVHVQEGGFAVFIWREPPSYEDGPHVYGTYDIIIENEKIVLSWQDGTDQVTKVKFFIEVDEDKVTLKVWHKGFTGEARHAHYQDFWESHLATLKRMLETGERPEIADRVIIGVMIDNGATPSEGGHRVVRAIEGYSAADAGIQGGDIITKVGGTVMDENTGILSVTADCKPGDELDITFVRDGEEQTVTATLKGHPVPPIPVTFEEMAQHHRDEYDRVNAALAPAIEGVTIEMASFKPDDDTEWNIQETLAHMILNQRHALEWLATYANGPRRINGYYRDAERIEAIVSVRPSVEALFAELKAMQEETIAMILAFDKAMEKRKDYMWWMVFEIWWTEDTAMRCVSEIEDLKAQAQAA